MSTSIHNSTIETTGAVEIAPNPKFSALRAQLVVETTEADSRGSLQEAKVRVVGLGQSVQTGNWVDVQSKTIGTHRYLTGEGEADDPAAVQAAVSELVEQARPVYEQIAQHVESQRV